MTRIGWRVKLGAILAMVAAVCGAVVVLVASGPSDADSAAVSRRALAAHEAGRLIAAVRIPGQVATPASEPESADPIAGLSRATGPVTVGRSGSWSASRSAAAVRALLDAHPPAGTRRAPGASLTFIAIHDPAGLASARLELTVVATGPRSSAVHAEALVRWLVARSPAERVPTGAHELEITRGAIGHAPSLVVRVSDRARIARIRALLDRLAPVQPGHVYHCPAQFAQVPVVSFVFRAGGSRSQVLAVATEQADVRAPTTACDAMHFTVGGREQAPLLGGYRLLREVSSLLGRRLWTGPYAA
ncbi:MAG TPA: hypothetical protein VMF07_15040 [Solirubrobacteraceae bacterium]|nr:hypothetical protein [Solirubrobacteraceae bacterium]